MKERMVKKKGKRERKQHQQNFLKERRGKYCQRATGQKLDTRNPCTLSSDNNTAGQQTLTNYPTQRKNERSR